MVGSHLIKTWSKTQSLLALSSGESELYGTLKASAEALGILSMMKDLGMHMRGRVLGDASAALGIIHRKGLGRTRHIDTGMLWIQQTAAEKRLEYMKVLGSENPADLMTKYLSQDIALKHCLRLSLTFNKGRAEAAPQLNATTTPLAVWEVTGDEEQEQEKDDDEEEWWNEVQIMINKLWRDKWRQHNRRGNATPRS